MEPNPFDNHNGDTQPLLNNNADAGSYVDRPIPTWNDLKDTYDQRWKRKRKNFNNNLRQIFLL